jgi:vesicle coat complex subunit
MFNVLENFFSKEQNIIKALKNKKSKLYKLYRKFTTTKNLLPLLDKMSIISMLASINQKDDKDKCVQTIEKACDLINEISKILINAPVIETAQMRMENMISLYKKIFNK